MAKQTMFPLLFFITTLTLVTPTTSQDSPNNLGWNCYYTKGNYTEISDYYSNLLNAFSKLTSLSSSKTFSTFIAGTDKDATHKVYALYDCRDDLTLQTCHECVEDATNNLLQMCSTKEAITIYAECMLRYANRPIFGMMEITPKYIDCGLLKLSDEGMLNRTIEPIFKRLIEEATSENSSCYFGVGEGSYFEYQKIYCLVQCTPDISKEQCKECLMDALTYTLKCANGSQLTSLHNVPNCQMRYGIEPFYDVSSSLSVPPVAPPNLSPQIKTGDGCHCLISIKTFVFVIFFFLLFNVM